MVRGVIEPTAAPSVAAEAGALGSFFPLIFSSRKLYEPLVRSDVA